MVGNWSSICIENSEQRLSVEFGTGYQRTECRKGGFKGVCGGFMRDLLARISKIHAKGHDGYSILKLFFGAHHVCICPTSLHRETSVRK